MTPLSQRDALGLIKRRHAEWAEFQKRWRWLYDSLEGGNRYRYANYVQDPLSEGAHALWYANEGISGAVGNSNTIDPVTGITRNIFYGVIAETNLIPHVSETAPDGANIYAMRLARTPVPTNLPRAIRKHLSTIFAHEVQREGPAAVKDWWEDVDGTGKKSGRIDKWVRKTAGPLLLALGQLDLVFDHPRAPEGVEIRSRADQVRYNLDRCVVSYILPENMLWWRLDPLTRAYEECLVFERCPEGVRFRHWTAESSIAYDSKGNFLPDDSRDHPFGRVPIVRVFDERKARCEHVGQSRYESVAEYQRELYNERSELILGDVFQVHPTLQGPEEFVSEDGRVRVGPTCVLPKKKDSTSGHYEGWEYVHLPKQASAELRMHIQDYSDEADREAALLKPAGMTSSTTVGQSGISKVADQQEGNNYLSEVAETLADAELAIAEMALLVISDGKPSDADLKAIEVIYPKEFDLYTLDDLMRFLTDLQAVTTAGGNLPQVEAEAVKRAVRHAFPGMTDEQLDVYNQEVDDFFQAKAEVKDQMAELRPLAIAAVRQPAAGGELGGMEATDISEADAAVRQGIEQGPP